MIYSKTMTVQKNSEQTKSKLAFLTRGARTHVANATPLMHITQFHTFAARNWIDFRSIDRARLWSARWWSTADTTLQREGNKFSRRVAHISPITIIRNICTRCWRVVCVLRLRLRPAAYKFVSICHAVVMNDDSAWRGVYVRCHSSPSTPSLSVRLHTSARRPTTPHPTATVQHLLPHI